MLDVSLKQLEMGYYELKVAFEGLADDHVWERPAPNLLSIGELAAHIVYWEAVKLASDAIGTDNEQNEQSDHQSPKVRKCRIQSPLIDEIFSYYDQTVKSAPSEEHRKMTPEAVLAEVLRVHEATVAVVRERNPAPGDSLPGWPENNTYGEFLDYAVFHTAYHTGQIYTVRHLLGEETPDN